MMTRNLNSKAAEKALRRTRRYARRNSRVRVYHDSTIVALVA